MSVADLVQPSAHRTVAMEEICRFTDPLQASQRSSFPVSWDSFNIPQWQTSQSYGITLHSCAEPFSLNGPISAVNGFPLEWWGWRSHKVCSWLQSCRTCPEYFCYKAENLSGTQFLSLHACRPVERLNMCWYYSSKSWLPNKAILVNHGYGFVPDSVDYLFFASLLLKPSNASILSFQ